MPTIRAVLSNLLPAEDANSIDIIANEVLYTDAEKKGDEWEIVYRHPESHYGHDKSKAILPYKDLGEDRPTLFFCGDGVSGSFTHLHSGRNNADGRFVRCCSRRCLVHQSHG